MVTLDFPQQTKLPAEQAAYNEKKQDHYGIEGFPTILVLDSEGALYAKTGYQRGGAAPYLGHLEEFAKRKAEIADLQAKIKKDPKDVASLEQLVAKAVEWEILIGDYYDLKVKLATTDGPNRAMHAADVARNCYERNDLESYKKYLEEVRKADPALAKEIEDQIALNKELDPLLKKKQWDEVIAKVTPLFETAKGGLKQDAYWWAGVCESQKGNHDKALEHLEKALEAAPNTTRAKQIQGGIDWIKKNKK